MTPEPPHTPDGQPPTRPTRGRANTRARLLDAAIGVFAEKGLRGTTVDDLTAAAGFTRGAFYSNFSTKEDVFYAAFERQTERTFRAVREIVGTPHTHKPEFSKIEAVLHALRPHGRLWYLLRTEFLLHAIRDPAAAQRFLDQRRRFEGAFTDILPVALKELGRRSTVPADQVTEILLSLYMRSLAIEAAAPPGDAEAGSTFLVQTVPAVFFGLSEPVEPVPEQVDTVDEP